jgi:hypothetical protein
MELFVILALQDVPGTDELNLAANKLSVPLVLEKEIDLSTQTGFLPAKINNNNSGAEVYVTPYAEIKSFLPEHDISNITNPVVITFRWGGDFQEAAVSMYSAYIISENYVSITFEPQSGVFLSSQQLLEGASAMQGLQ